MDNQNNETVTQNESQYVSITEAAKKYNVTRQAIYVAIKLNKLRAKKDESRWTIHVEDLEAYRKGRYCRSRSRFDGELIFDSEKGLYSINQVAKVLGVPAQKIYYATRIGALPAQRKGAAWVIHKDNVELYKQKEEEKKLKKKTV